MNKKFNIKTGDTVIVIAGKDKGKTGNVTSVIKSNDRVIVEGVNIAKKHQKPTQDNPGGINEIATPIHISNLMLIDPKSGTATRIGRKVVDGKIMRYSKKSGEIIK